MDWEFRRSRKRDVSDDSFEERRNHRINFNDRIDFFHHNEDSTLYKRNLCFICQNPSIVIDKSQKCESCGKLVCHNCSYICSRCNRFVCSFCENTVYSSKGEEIVCIDCCCCSQ